MQTWFMVGVGGAVGSMARHGVNIWISRHFGQSIPFATATVNLVGCAVIGLLAGLIAGEHLRLPPAARTLVFVGILGGFTTFSSFGLDTLTLVHEGRAGHAALNVLFQVGLGLAAVFAGFSLGAVR